jgi:hypothetical protein
MKLFSLSVRSAAACLVFTVCLLAAQPLRAAGTQSQTITFNAIPAQSVGGTLTVSATASSGLAVTFSIVQNGNCSINGAVVTFLNVGNCGVIANQAGNSTYAAAPAVGQIIVVNAAAAGTFTLSLANTTITLQPGNGVADVLTVNDSNGFTGAVTLSVSGLPSGVGGSFYPSNPTTGSTNLVVYVPTGTAAGSYPLTVTGVSGGLTVTTAATLVVPGTQTISFPAIAAQKVGTPLTLSATATSGLAVSFASSTTGVCTVSGTTATFVAAGTCTITASQPGNNVYTAAPSVTQSFSVTSAATFTLSLATPTITLQPGNGVADVLTVNDSNGFSGAVTLSASGLPAGVGGSFYPSNPTTGSTNLVVYVPSGTAAGSYPLTITGVSGSLTVTTPATLIVPGTQTISFAAIAGQTAPGTLALSATATSGLAVSFSSSTQSVCTVSGSSVTLIAAGTCTITATQAGNAVYSAATPVVQSFNVTSGSTLTAQSITFSNPGAQSVGAPIALTASASSGLAVTLTSSTPTVCSISGTAANFATAGTCTISAAQPGNATYAAATTVTQSFSVTGSAAPVSAYYTICQAQPTTGSYCTDGTPSAADANGYHDLPWTNLNKNLVSIAVSDNHVWGVDAGGVLWYLPNFKTGTTWTQVATNVTQISAGHNLVCQISTAQHVLCGIPNAGSGAVTWTDTGATNLKQIAASAGKQFWAVDTSGNLIQIKDYTQFSSSSTMVASGVAQVAVDGRGVVCIVTTAQTISCSNWSAPSATANPAPYYPLPFVQTTSQLKNIAVVEGQVLGTDSIGNEWLLQDWANSATWFEIAYGGAGTVMAGASIPSQYLAADFAPGEVPVLMFMGQSNSSGYNELTPRFLSPASPNVWAIQNAGWNYMPGNNIASSPLFTNPISSITSVQWTNYNLTPSGPDLNIGLNFNLAGGGPSAHAANFTAYQWQGLVNAGWPLPDLYIIHIAWPAEGLDPADNAAVSPSAQFESHGLALWQPTLTASQEPSYALAPFARTIVYRALQNLLAAGKTPRLLGLQWNQWETDAQFAAAIADAPTNYNNLFSGFYAATGINFPIQLVRPLSTFYGAIPLTEMQTVFANLVANDPTDFSLIDISTVSSTIYSGGIFGGGDGSVHYNFDTHNWFAHQAIGTCLLQANCGVRIPSVPASAPN